MSPRCRLPGVLLVLLAFAACADVAEEPVLPLLRLDGSTIEFYLLAHDQSTPSPVLLLVLQGSDCNSVLHIESIFSAYKNVWPTADLLLIEKYGLYQDLAYSSDGERADCPKAYIEHDSPAQRVLDAEAVFATLRKTGNYRHILVVGGSEGAVVANMLAARVDYIDATISFNGGGRWFVDDVLHNMAAVIPDADEATSAAEGFRGFVRGILASEPLDSPVSGHGYRWWRQMLSIDQQQVLKEVESPVLIVQGGIDVSVSPGSVDDMMSAVRESGNDHVEYRRYPGLGHGFNDVDGVSGLERVVADMHAWLVATLSSTEQP